MTVRDLIQYLLLHYSLDDKICDVNLVKDRGFLEGIRKVYDEVLETTWYSLSNGKIIQGAAVEEEALYKHNDIENIFKQYGVID